VSDPQQVLRDQFGLDVFRPGQRAVIDRLLAGKHVAAVFPTGGGKSLCYQLPSQVLPGTTVVVSPLIALMKDQCDALARRGIAAARLDSTLSPDEFRHAIAGVRDKSIKLLYVAPERFFNERFLATIGGLDISLFAIDEAHCISQWGHNFRPDYLKLAELTKDLQAGCVLALTATATPAVLDDIRAAFGIEPDDAICTPFHRSNLVLRSSIVSAEQQYATLMERIRARPRGSTLVYVTLQKTAEEIAARLSTDALAADHYHAGLNPEQRSTIQQRFIDSDSGIVVATIAFGMGIDKPNIRYVYHFNPPKSLESYAQEIGRAGRDGEEAICELLLAPEDRIVLENFTYGDTPSRDSIARLIDLIAGQPDPFHVSHYKLSYETDIRILVVRTLLTYLELEGFFKAISPRYDTYKIQPRVTSQVILSHFTGERRQFVGNLLACLTKGRTWFTLNMTVATKRLQQDRQRIVQALDYLAERGWLELQVSDLVHGFRWLRRIEDRERLADSLYERLVAREVNEVARLDGVWTIATAGSCQAGTLSAHFGQPLAEPCGQCSACLGHGPFEIPAIRSRSIGSSARRIIEDVVREYPAQFPSPRDKARFLCGLSSPQFTRAKLSRHSGFGICDRVPFADVLAQIQT
jgi:ATP-dependent DNA helicase RecQ